LHHNFKQHILDYIKSDEGLALKLQMDELGCSAEDIDYISIGFVPHERAIYSIARLSNGKIAIFANKASHSMIVEEGELFDMDADELRGVIIAEEIAHDFRKSYDKHFGRVGEERATKETLRELYETLAKTTNNPKLRAKYERIIDNLNHDIATVSRYAKTGRNSLESLVDMYNADVGELVNVLAEEGRIYEGINSVDAIEEYVSARLGEIEEAADVEYSSEEAVDVDAYVGTETLGGVVEGEVSEAVEAGDGEACAAEASGDSDGDSDGDDGE